MSLGSVFSVARSALNAQQVVIQIGEQPYLAAYHPQVRVRALYPLFETGAAPT